MKGMLTVGRRATGAALRFRGRIVRRCAVVLALLAATAPAARADVVTDWTVVIETVAPRFGGPQQQSRVQTIAHVAIHDALNTIVPRYERYTDVRRARHSASPDAAVAAAGQQALLILLGDVPDSPLKQAAIATIEAAYTATVGPGPYDAATQAGLDAGAASAAAIVALRTGDGSATPNLPYTLGPGPGVYQPTPNPEFPAVITPSFAGWGYVTPFALHYNTQFEVPPGALFDLSSRRYAREYNEVKQLGDARTRGALPDSQESDIARFWPGGGSNWSSSTREIVRGRGLDLWEHARLFALLNMAQADALIANQLWKYTYNFWRPVTAIRWADDGNPDTSSDPAWRPFLVTPPYPDYPCALPSATGAAAEVLRQLFGTDRLAFTRTFNAPAVPLPVPLTPLPTKAITRSFESLSNAVAEAKDARVYAGLHFRQGCNVGARQGEQIARFVVRHQLESTRHCRKHNH